MIQQANLATLLKLERPLVCVDVETHDKCSPDKAHIIEMGMIIFYPGDKPPKMWQSLFRLPDGVKIHPAATQVHKITHEMIDERIEDAVNGEADGKRFRWPTFSQMARNLAMGFKDCDYCGYNGNFDLRCIDTGMKRAGVPWTYEGAMLLDPLRLWQKLCPRTNSDFVRAYAKREPGDSHRALADIQDTIDGFAGFFQAHNLPDTVKGCHELCKDAEAIDADRKFSWKNGVAVVNFGKWNGTPLTDINKNAAFRGYLEWMIRQDFHPTSKRVAQDALAGKFPVAPTENAASDSSS